MPKKGRTGFFRSAGHELLGDNPADPLSFSIDDLPCHKINHFTSLVQPIVP
jgi:hypothetical protein